MFRIIQHVETFPLENSLATSDDHIPPPYDFVLPGWPSSSQFFDQKSGFYTFPAGCIYSFACRIRICSQNLPIPPPYGENQEQLQAGY